MRRSAAVVVMAIAIGGGMSGGIPAGAAADTRVSMKEFAFAPASVTIRAGDSVVWTYDESATDPVPNCESPYLQAPPSPGPHCPGHSTTSVTTPPGGVRWDSGLHRADGFPYRVTFSVPGTYHYICTIHGGPQKNNPLTSMEGDVIVQPAPGVPVGAGPASPPPTVLGAAARRLPATGVPIAPLLFSALALLLAGAWLRIAASD